MMNTITRKEEILSTASRLFRERGYSAVTMRDLAKEMGIKAASLYNHINSKQQILSEIVMPIAQQFVDGIDAVKNSDYRAEDQLRQIIEQHVILTVKHPSCMAAVNNDWMHLEGNLEEYLKMRSYYEAIFKQIIEDGIEDGSLTIIDKEVMLFSFLSTLRNLYLWILKNTQRNEDELIFALSETLLKGVVKCK